MDRIEHGLLNMNMISKEKYDSLVASGYYKLTSSSGLLEIPSEVLDIFFKKVYKDITLENFRALLPEGKDIYDYGDLCHKALSNGYDFDKVTCFISDLILEGYNMKFKNGENKYTFLQDFLLFIDYDNFYFLRQHSHCSSRSLPGNNYTNGVIKLFDFYKNQVNINIKDKDGNSIIHTLITNCKYKGTIIPILLILSEKFDFDCKNNQNMGIIETLDECINRCSRSSDESIREKGMLLSDESEEIKKIVYGLIKYQKDRKQIISEKDKNNKTEQEIENIYNKISCTLDNTNFFNESVQGLSKIYDEFKEIADDMKYYRNGITNNIVFDLDTILAIKKTLYIEYEFKFDPIYDPHHLADDIFPSMKILLDAIKKFNHCVYNEEKNAEEVTVKRNLNKIIKRFLEKLIYQLSFEDIIKNRNIILLFKKVLKKNFDYIIEHTDNMETEEDFILVWSKYEEQMKEIIRFGIKILKTPVNANEIQNILQTLEAFGFDEEIDLLNKKISNTTDEANKVGDSSILAPVKEEYKNQIKRILKVGLETLVVSPDISTMNIMLQALEACGLNEEAELLKKEIEDYTAGNLLEEIIEDEIKTGTLYDLEIDYLQSMFEDNGFPNVSKLIENKVKEKKEKEEKEKVKKKGKI